MVKRVKRESSVSERPKRTEQLIIENFVAFQKVMMELSGNFEKLSKQIASLLELFEGSAKAVVEKESIREKESPEIKELMKKIDYLMEQNKTIARGMVMLHEKSSGYSSEPLESSGIPEIPIPSAQKIQKNSGMQGYQKSIASGP